MSDSGFRLALERLRACPEFARIIPEVRTNLVYAAERAQHPREVLAVEGRITVVAGRPHPAGPPVPGASDHMARLIIELARRDPAIRAGINFASNPGFDRWLADYAARQGWVASVIDRRREPAELEREEQPSIPWKVEEAVRAAGGRIPKVFRETAAPGKEPLTFLVGPDPVTVVDEACALARAWAAGMGNAYITRWSQPDSPPGG
jgi:hydroxymethylpyrimidine/phosphomethylpyrimidine kinase